MPRVNQTIRYDEGPASITLDAVADRRWRVLEVITPGGSAVTITTGATVLVDLTTTVGNDQLRFGDAGLQCGANEDLVVTSTGDLTLVTFCE